MIFNKKHICYSLLALLVFASCSKAGAEKNKDDRNTSEEKIDPTCRFDADTAFNYVRQQVAIGPRVSGTEGNRKVQHYIVENLNRSGAKVLEQKATVTAYDGTKLNINNIMGRFNTDNPERILLLAHHDTRPWADNESNPVLAGQPIPGANDGGSGVAVLLEIARQLGQKAPEIGVDLLFVDAEDYGNTVGFGNSDETWCLGSQYWTANMPYEKDKLPRYCVVVDMVGGINAQFHREFLSVKHAPELVDKIWSVAHRSGYGDRFINRNGGSIIDDHLYINMAGIPAIDIIESRNPETHSFPPTWHTHDDNLSNIDKSSLKAVGQTLLNLIHNEK